jgi:hypothetical protein
VTPREHQEELERRQRVMRAAVSAFKEQLPEGTIFAVAVLLDDCPAPFVAGSAATGVELVALFAQAMRTVVNMTDEEDDARAEGEGGGPFQTPNPVDRLAAAHVFGRNAGGPQP